MIYLLIYLQALSSFEQVVQLKVSKEKTNNFSCAAPDQVHYDLAK